MSGMGRVARPDTLKQGARHEPHPLRTLIETCDAAISRRDFDALMTFYAEDAALVVKPGMVVRGIPAIRRAFTAISRLL